MDRSVTINDSASILSAASASTRHYLSSQHLWTALHNAEQCRHLEQELAGKVAIDVTHGSHAMTSVLSAVAFLEAFVNEIYSDAADNRHQSPRVEGLDEPVQAMMAEYWTATDQGYGQVLPKYNMALLFAGHQGFNKGADPYQAAEVLINLRNTLMHFKPTWHDEGTPDRLDKMLPSRIQQSGLLPADDGSPWIPIKVLGASCAKWAPRIARALTDEWTTRLGIPRTYEADLASWRNHSGKI